MSINSAHGAFEIDGVHTEVVVTEYADRVLVLATQIGKLGTMYLTRDAGPGGGAGSSRRRCACSWEGARTRCWRPRRGGWRR